MDVFYSEDDLIEYVKELLLTDGFELYILQNGSKIPVKHQFEDNAGKTISTAKYDVTYTLSEKPQIIDSVDKLLTWLPKYDDVLIPVNCGEDGHRKIISLNDLSSAMKSDGEVVDQNIQCALNYYKSKKTNHSTLDEVIIDELCHLARRNIQFVRYLYYSSAEKLKEFNECAVTHRGRFADATARRFICLGRVLNKQEYIENVERLISLQNGDAKYNEENLNEKTMNDVWWRPYPRATLRCFQATDHYVLLPVNERSPFIERQLYVKGIRIGEQYDPFYSFPGIANGKISIAINVKSDDYAINIARTQLTKESSSKLLCDVLRDVCKEVACDADWSFTETEHNVLLKCVEQYQFGAR